MYMTLILHITIRFLSLLLTDAPKKRTIRTKITLIAVEIRENIIYACIHTMQKVLTQFNIALNMDRQTDTLDSETLPTVTSNIWLSVSQSTVSCHGPNH